jgi:hypothetical protein
VSDPQQFHVTPVDPDPVRRTPRGLARRDARHDDLRPASAHPRASWGWRQCTSYARNAGLVAQAERSTNNRSGRCRALSLAASGSATAGVNVARIHLGAASHGLGRCGSGAATFSRRWRARSPPGPRIGATSARRSFGLISIRTRGRLGQCAALDAPGDYLRRRVRSGRSASDKAKRQFPEMTDASPKPL